jgi:protein O-mannosyl-transferase
MTTFFRMAVLGPRPLCAGAVLCLLLTVLVYAPGLHGPVIFDDMPNIFENGRMQAVDGFDGRKIAAATWSGDAGPLKRPVSMLTFALNYAATGADVFYFKVTNLAVHLITGLSLGYLTWLLLGAYRERQRPDLSPVRQAWLSLLVAAAWLLHPLNLSPVLHVVQRMTSLCALFTVWGLIFYLLGRERLTRHGRSLAGWSMIGFGLFGFGALAALSKENGALLPFFMILIEALLFDFHCRTAQARRRLVILCTAFVLSSAVFGLYYLGAFRPSGLSGAYVNRPFTWHERALTEGRVLWFYLKMLLWPDIRAMGVFHDDFSISAGLLSPLPTLLAWLGWLLMILLVVLVRRKAPLFAFGVLFFLIGHSMESGIVALDLIHEHRNYLPAFGILLALLYYATHPRLYAGSRWPAAGLTGIVVLAVLAFTTAARAGTWSNIMTLMTTDVTHHPQSARSSLMFGKALFDIVEKRLAQGDDSKEIQSLRGSVRDVFENIRRKDDFYLNAHIWLLALDQLEGKPTDRAALTDLIRRLQRPPLSVNTLDVLYGQFEQRMGQGRGLSSELLQQLFAAVAKNPGLRGGRKAGVLAVYAKLADVNGDGEQALRLARQAVAIDPNEPSLRTLLALQLVKNGLSSQDKESKTVVDGGGQ